MATSKERQYNSGQWSLGRFNSFVTSLLRSGSRKWAPKYETLFEARTEKKPNIKTGRIAQHFKCNSCGNDFPQKEVEIDHIVPIGTEKTWDEFIDALFCEKDNLQCLCKQCHLKKSLSERKKK